MDQTTLMVRNIPIKFTREDMLTFINKKFAGKYDYFYLPKDIRTHCNMGFAFINMAHPIYIIDFYLEFHCCKWQEFVTFCNSSKYCEITYANV